MRNSTFIVLSFLGLIFLAASLIWMPLPEKPLTTDPGMPATVPPPIAASSQKLDDPEKPTSLIATQKSDTATLSSDVAKTVPQVSSLMFPEWPKPLLAFVVTGEQFGYFEPCGCTANQLGGMARRAGLFSKIESLGWTVRGVDVGGLSRRSGPQAQIKFETMLEALREMKYVALGMGVAELRLDPGYLLAQHLDTGDPRLCFLGANLTFLGTKEIGTPLSFTIVEVQGCKVGITSVMSDKIRREVIPDRTPEEAAVADLQWGDPTEALTDVLSRFEEEKVDFRVLLSQSTDEEIREQAAAFPQFDIIVAADGKDGDREPEMIGAVRLLRVGEKGKTAGVVGLYPKGEKDSIRYELVTVSAAHFSESEKMAELMKVYQGRLKDSSIVTAENPVAHPSGATFVGASKCGECHTTAFDIWKETTHARAFESLDPVHQHHGYERLHGIARDFDPECLSCHVTGWDPEEYVRFQNGFLNEEIAADDSEKLLQALMGGSQCENCHGPGSRHVELIEAGNTEAAAKEVRVTLEHAKNETCGKCHDADNSPDFNFEKYWEKVKHPGLD